MNLDQYLGELGPGQNGWLPLDEKGMPTGPATLLPPPVGTPGAAAVSVNGNGHLVSVSGSELNIPLNSNVEKRMAPVVNFAMTGLDPNSAKVGDPDFELYVNGTGFTENSVIVWNGGDEPTMFVSPQALTTIVKPSTVSGPVTLPVQVRDGDKLSTTHEFTFLPADPIA